ncbi:hypothetical protein L7750_17420 [Xenorhabdus bovienii]|uniref:hypothetical protein n=1 Tax=Xenorhabdus bovienii TaxID=40576 RepID=UPI001EDF85D2|nr:hypothetical protein [Xenorhabdus bovienii]MCG3464226.1 hypothetical protein [Xenorhabdus bovienii]MCG3472093.1 hypothetical protein [Xenorhabdus bovienii]
MTMSEIMKMKLEDEKNRVLSSFSVIKKDEGFIVDYIANCNESSASDILDKVKEILLLIHENSFSTWPSIDKWSSILPKEFVSSFSDSDDSDDWTLNDWLYWLEPENRAWFLWDVKELGSKCLKISIVVYEHPFPWEALEVLFMKMGTDELEEETF